MSKMLHALFCVWCCSTAALAPAFASEEDYAVTRGDQLKRPPPPRPACVPLLNLTQIQKKKVDSPRSIAIMEDLHLCTQTLQNLKTGAPQAQEMLTSLYARATTNANLVSHTPKYRNAYQRLATSTLLRMLAEPHVSFPITLGATPCDKVYCTYLACSLAEKTGDLTLKANALISLTDHTQGPSVFMGGKTVSKGALLLEAYALFSSRHKVQKAKALLSLLKVWPEAPLHLDGRPFTRQECVETLYRLTLSRHFPLTLQEQIYHDLQDLWLDTRPFNADIPNINLLAIKTMWAAVCIALFEKNHATARVHQQDENDTTPRLQVKVQERAHAVGPAKGSTGSAPCAL